MCKQIEDTYILYSTFTEEEKFEKIDAEEVVHSSGTWAVINRLFRTKKLRQPLMFCRKVCTGCWLLVCPRRPGSQTNETLRFPEKTWTFIVLSIGLFLKTFKLGFSRENLECFLLCSLRPGPRTNKTWRFLKTRIFKTVSRFYRRYSLRHERFSNFWFKLYVEYTVQRGLVPVSRGGVFGPPLCI